MAKKKSKGKGGNASHSGPVTGPNALSLSAKKSGGNNNSEQTASKVASESYIKAQGG